jgi:polyphosphate:AMP phosphotransferase
MFQHAEIEHRIPKEQYAREVPRLKEELLRAQYQLLESAERALLIVVAGVDGAGKGETISQLQSWLDPRYVRVHGIGRPTAEEQERPTFYRYWKRLPPKGKTSVLMGSWYTQPIIDRVYKRTKDTHLDTSMEGVRHFERMLHDEEIIILKLWFHLSKKDQAARLERLAKDEATAWRVTERDWKNFERYDRFRRVSGRALRQTSSDFAPWLVLNGNRRRYRELAVGRAVLESLQRSLARPPKEPEVPSVPHTPPSVDGTTILDTVDLSKSLRKDRYDVRLERAQGRIATLIREPKWREKHSLVCVFEGQDAAGKGGAIRRLVAPLDARQYDVIRIAAPTDEEKARPYLWRFWRHLPRRGRVAVYDRSWYGRVLVERVEGYADPGDWRRAYGEIVDFERQLIEHGTVVVKVWLEIDAEEQLRRFEERQKTGYKRHKITEEDWRNRDKWGAYRQAVDDMIARTSTEPAPWHLIGANDKRHARVAVLETVADAVEAVLG